jgi:hypothetical protein
MPISSRSVVLVWPLLLATCATLPGCSEELGPVPLDVTSVRGVVTEGRKPITGGWVEFFPVDGTVGNLRSARLRPDGTFQADRVAVGRNLIRLVNFRSESKSIEHLFGSMQSPIRRVVVKNATEPITIDLFEEAMAYQRSRQLPSGAQPAKAGKPQ